MPVHKYIDSLVYLLLLLAVFMAKSNTHTYTYSLHCPSFCTANKLFILP